MSEDIQRGHLRDDLNGTAETKEQVRDVYTAGTSDGVVFLADGKTRNLSEKAAPGESAASESVERANQRGDLND